MALTDFLPDAREEPGRQSYAGVLDNAWSSRQLPALQSGGLPEVPLARRMEKHLASFAPKPPAKATQEGANRWQSVASAEAQHMIQLRGSEEWVEVIRASMAERQIMEPPWLRVPEREQLEPDADQVLEAEPGPGAEEESKRWEAQEAHMVQAAARNSLQEDGAGSFDLLACGGLQEISLAGASLKTGLLYCVAMFPVSETLVWAANYGVGHLARGCPHDCYW